MSLQKTFPRFLTKQEPSLQFCNPMTRVALANPPPLASIPCSSLPTSPHLYSLLLIAHLPSPLFPAPHCPPPLTSIPCSSLPTSPHLYSLLLIAPHRYSLLLIAHLPSPLFPAPHCPPPLTSIPCSSLRKEKGTGGWSPSCFSKQEVTIVRASMRGGVPAKILTNHSC